ncbi:MAG TPA: diguanylate cyclase [Rhodanobacteraceae bacterium]|jgi:diguanylate cyclase (GGDEF)-like protein|nr:diguanylate cyclase [Rhodanobacteraceae bacterium]
MGLGTRRLGLLLLLLCWPLVAWSGSANVRVVELPGPPATMGSAASAPPATGASASPVWLHAPHTNTVWRALYVAQDWHGSSPPMLSIGGNTRARVTAYLPPDYRPHTDTIFKASLDPTLSHHEVVYRLPPDLHADQPIYLELGDPGQTQPLRVRITDEATYRTEDLWHVRLSTFFNSVQLSMVLVILCFWVVLRDRMFLHFIVYVAAQVVYALSVSGELYALPGAALLTPLGYHVGQCAAALASAFSIWFILEFADLRAYTPRLAAWLGAMRWPYLAMAVIVWLPFLRPDAWLPNTVNVLLIASTVLALASSWMAWRHGNRQAGFFLLSWVPLLAFTVTRVVQLIVGWPLPAWLEYGFPGSMAWAAVIITVGLADRTLQARNERDQATRMAQFDPLTGVFNRRAIMEKLHETWQAVTATSEPLAVLFLDLDHFKQINDSRGHAAGDACLAAVTDVIRTELGEADRVGRYGGEEFVVVLRGDNARMAGPLAGRIANRVAALRVPAGERLIALTVSVGVAVRDASMTSPEALVDHADAAQYQAKAEGRNRVVVYRPDLPVAAPVR